MLKSAGGWRHGFGLCWDGDIFLSTGVMIVRMGEACPMGDGKLLTGEGGSELGPGD